MSSPVRKLAGAALSAKRKKFEALIAKDFVSVDISRHSMIKLKAIASKSQLPMSVILGIIIDTAYRSKFGDVSALPFPDGWTHR